MSRRGGGFAAFQASAKKEEEAAKQEGPKTIGADVLRRSRRPDPNLDLEGTKALLERLRSDAVSAQFQAALANVRARDYGAFKKRKAVAKLLAMGWKDALKAFGYGINEVAFPQVLATVRRHAFKPGIRTLSEEVEKTLKFFPGALFGSKAGELKQSDPQSGRKAFSAAVQGTGASPGTIAPEPEGPSVRDRTVNLGEAKEMLKAFAGIARSADFQRTIESMRQRGASNYASLLPNFVGSMWKPTLEIFDFPATPAGFQECFRGISKHGWNLHVKTQAHEIERLLFTPIGSTFYIPGDGSEEPPLPSSEAAESSSSAPGKRPPRPGDIEVEVAHAVHGTSIKVNVASSATFLDIKEAIVALLGRDEMMTRGKLVKKNGGIYSSYKDHDPIGTLRSVMVLGVDLALPEAPKSTGNGRVGDHAPYQNTGPSIHPYAANASPNRIAEEGKLFPSQLTLQQALNLQTELHFGFSQPAFQEKLQSLQEQFEGTPRYVKECSDHILNVQQTILPRYGFQGNQKGVHEMLQAFGPHNDNPDIKKKGEEINKLLPKKLLEPTQLPSSKADRGAYLQGGDAHDNLLAAAGVVSIGESKSVEQQSKPKSSAPTPKPPAPKPEPAPPREIELVVRHATKEPDMIQLKVMTDWTFKKVKETLATAITHDDVSRKARLVYKSGSDWKAHQDSAVIGDRTELFCLGVDSLKLVAREVDISIQHAIETARATPLTVWTNWTFKEVREALARRVGSDEIREKARFVFKSGNEALSWMSFKDDELLGERKKLHLLGCDLPDRLKPEKPKEIEVNVKNVRSNAQVQVIVLSTATMRDVKQAISKHIGRNDIVTEGKLVQPQGHAPYQDNDLLGKRRRLLFVGPDFTLEAELENTLDAVEDKVEEKEESVSATFTLQQAHTLLGRIREVCSQPDVQEKAADPLTVGETFMDACAGPAAESGFGTGENALRLMLSALKGFVTDPVVQKHLEEIEGSLQLPSGSVMFIADSIVAAAAA